MWQRSSPKLLVVRLVEMCFRYVPFVLFFLSARARVDGWLSTALTVFFWYYTATRPYALLADWLTLRYRLSDGGIHIRRGLIRREVTEVTWAELVAVQRSRSTLQQLLGITDLSLGLGSTVRAEVVIPGLEVADAEQIARRVPGDAHPDRPAKEGAPAPERGELVFSMRPRDYLIVAVTYGQILAALPLGVSLLADGGSLVGIDVLPGLSESLLGIPGLGLAALVGLTAIVGGTALAWLRYRGFESHWGPQGLQVRGGWSRMDERRVPAHAVMGLACARTRSWSLWGCAN